MNTSGIYKIANKITGDFYIGSAVNLNKRFISHKSRMRTHKHGNKYLQNVYDKYGLKNLEFIIIEKVSNNLIKREQHYIDTLNPKYNLRRTAESNIGIRFGPMAEETKLKISLSNKGHRHSEETKNKISNFHKGNSYWLGKKHKQTTIDKLSETFQFKDKNGNILDGKNLNLFCRENNLDPSSMCKVLHGKRKSHKGWTKG